MAADNAVSLAFLIGMFPTISMMMTSTILYYLSVPPLVEACLQNFAGGLILAAVAAELFPLILEESKEDIWVGVFFGFICGFIFLNSFDTLIEASSNMSKAVDLSNIFQSLGVVSNVLNGGHRAKGCGGAGDCGCHDCTDHTHAGDVVANPMFKGLPQDAELGGQKKKGCKPDCACHDCSDNSRGHSHSHEHRSEHGGAYGALEESTDDDCSGTVEMEPPRHKSSPERTHPPPPPPGESPESPKLYEKKSKVVCEDCTNVLEASSHGSDMAVLENHELEMALNAIMDPEHKDHLHGHLLEMTNVISDMEMKSRRFIEDSLTNIETEKLAEEVDESIHQLQYQLDHCRRLLQGSEAGIGSTHMTTWLTEEKKIAMNDRLKLLRLTAIHLVDHIKNDAINEELIHEMHQHMKEMDRHINHFHDAMDTWTSKWRSITLPNVEYGAKLPMSLVIPVTLDCFVDGFLIGVSIALSPKAGYVLAGANCLEMGSLGMAYSARIAKCTGSSYMNRQLAMYCPPILMLLSSGFGALLADASHSVPAVFVAFVAFGVYALIALVCGELIIEAKEAHADDEKWWINACLFFGIFCVLMLHPVL